MKSRRNTPAEAVDPTPSEQPVAKTASWTKGSVFGARAATVGLYGFLLVYPFVASLVVSSSSSTDTAVAADSATQVRSTEVQAAGSVAAQFVGAWLSATQQDSAQLQTFVDASGLNLPQVPWPYRDLSIVSVGEESSAGVVPVEVAVQLEETSIAGEAPVTSWQTRYFAVAVQVAGDSLRPMGLPAPIAGPANDAKPADLGYGAKILADSPAAETVSSFLTAYLSGNGDVSVYVTPSKEITAVQPAPYSAVKVTSLTGDTEPEENPDDGTELHARVKAELTTGTGQMVTAEYSLTMTARADRWEVTSIDPTPVLKTSTAK